MEGNSVGIFSMVFVVQKKQYIKVREFILFTPNFTRNHENLAP
jgi:hypothetical protein